MGVKPKVQGSYLSGKFGMDVRVKMDWPIDELETNLKFGRTEYNTDRTFCQLHLAD